MQLVFFNIVKQTYEEVLYEHLWHLFENTQLKCVKYIDLEVIRCQMMLNISWWKGNREKDVLSAVNSFPNIVYSYLL